MYEVYLKLFMTHLENNNRAETTMRQYRRELERFFEFLAEHRIQDLNDIKTMHIDLYIATMSENTSTTRNKKVKVLKSFFKFLHTREYIEKNRMEVIDNIKIKDVDKKQKFVLTRKEQEKLLKTVTKHARNKSKSRLLILIMLKCALRVDEVCNLKKEHVDMKNKTIKVEGKGGKIRYVPLFDDMIPDLKLYLKSRKDKNELLFVNDRGGQQMTTRGVHDFVKTYVAKANIDKTIGCHALRRTAATQLLKEGAKITSIQKFMGHSNINTTEMYLLESESEIQDEIRSKTKKLYTDSK